MFIITINMLLLLIRAPTVAAIEMSADGSCYRGRDIAVGIATIYGLDGLGLETRWFRNFCVPIHTGLEAHSACCTVQGTPGLFPNGKAAGAWRSPSNHF